MSSIYVVDTGSFEVYVFASSEAEACEQVIDDVDDIGRPEDLLE